MKDAEPLKHVINLAKRYKLKEINHYEKLLEMYASIEEIKSKFRNDINRCINEKAQKNRSKYTKYLEVNPHLQTPKIYNDVHRRNDVCMVSKLRTSAHNLQIEMGRRTGTARENRKCHCGQVEDEHHFLVQCPSYIDIRVKYNIRHTDRICTILNNDNCHYIQELYTRRQEITTTNN